VFLLDLSRYCLKPQIAAEENNPCESSQKPARFLLKGLVFLKADGGKVQRVDYRRQRDDPGFDVSPCFAETDGEAFPANIALKGFGRRCLRNRHLAV
jgi:hypothetical protein